MKKLFAMCMAAALLVCACSSPKERTIEMPAMAAVNTTDLDVKKVELTDSNTVLTMNVNFRPGWWIRIAGTSKIVADGKEYAMLTADGITPDEQFIMPESGETEFKLTFPAIPLSTQQIDFTEGTDDGWKIWGIDVSGETVDMQGYPSSLPKSFINKDLATINLKPEMKAEESTITFKVLDYNPEYGNKLEVVMLDMAGQNTETLKLDGSGTATLIKTIYGPTTIMASLDNLTPYWPTGITVLPGENVEMLLDPRISVTAQMNRRDENFRLPASTYDNGSLAALNQNSALINKYELSVFDPEKFSWKLDADEFTDKLIAMHNEMADSIKASTELPENIKQYLLADLDLNTLSGLANAKHVLANSFYYTHRNDRNADARDSIKCELGDEHYARVAKAVNLDNPYLPMSDTMHEAFQTDWSKYVPSKQAAELYAFTKLYKDASKGQLSETQIDEAKKMSSPFYADAAVKRNAEALKAIEASADLITELPDAANDKLFEAIVKPYKGKVVLVDLWNTWCGPCRAALKANEPLKSGELANDDIVWIYIADESSELNKYLKMIPDIKGIHHMVNSDQIQTIRKQFDVDGIPFYILVDRNGKATGHPDFRDHSKLVEGIKSAL